MGSRVIFRTGLVIIFILLAAKALSSNLLSGPAVSVTDTLITINLKENITLSLAKECNIIKGINYLKVNNREILSPPAEGSALPVMTVIAKGKIDPADDWVAYLNERREKYGNSVDYPRRGGLETERIPVTGEFEGWRQEDDGVIISVRLEHGVAEWVIRTAEKKVGDCLYYGIRWKLRLRDAGRPYEIIVEEPVPFERGDWKLAQVWGEDFPAGSADWKRVGEVRMGYQREYYLPERGYFAWQQPFFFLAGKGGSVVSFFDRVVYASVSERQSTGSDWVTVRSRIPVKAGEITETPYKYWLYKEDDLSSRWDAINEWTWVYDLLAELYRGMNGVRTVEPKPTMFHQQFRTPGIDFWDDPRDIYLKTREVPPVEDSWFYAFANQILPRAHEIGIRTINLRGVLHSTGDHDISELYEGSLATRSILSPWRIEVSPAYGGVQGLAYVCV